MAYARDVGFAISAAVIALGSVLATEPSEIEKRRSIEGGWVSVSPVGVAIPDGSTSDVRTFDRAVVPSYRWGAVAGLAFEPVEHLLVAVGGSFQQSIWTFDNHHGYELCFLGDCYGWTERGIGNLVKIGAELRLGWTSRYVLAWGVFGAHIGIGHVRLDCDNSVEDHCDLAETDLGPGLRGGLGFALRATPKLAFGLESSIDHTRLDGRNDPFSAVRTWDLALIAIVRF